MVIVRICGNFDQAEEIVSLEITNEWDAPDGVVGGTTSAAGNGFAVDFCCQVAGKGKAARITADTPTIREVHRFLISVR